jgi:hypothetical protein
MSAKPEFWYALMGGLLALYALAIVVALQGQVTHVAVRLTLAILVAHVLELPLAFRMLKDRQPRAARVVVATLLFGLLWWLPARRGLLPVA